MAKIVKNILTCHKKVAMQQQDKEEDPVEAVERKRQNHQRVGLYHISSLKQKFNVAK